MKKLLFIHATIILNLLCYEANAFEILPFNEAGGAKSYRTNSTVYGLVYVDERDDLDEFEDVKTLCTQTKQYMGNFYNNPIHEAMTRDAYNSVFNPGLVASWRSTLISGVRWNDDPEYLIRRLVYKNAYTNIKEFNQRANSKRINGSLTARSHSGDLQYIHSMAPIVNGEILDTDETKEKIYVWLRTLWNIVNGDIKYDDYLQDTPLNNDFANVGCGNTTAESKSKSCTTLELFDLKRFWRPPYRDPEITIRELALGAFLHTIQDSYSSTHVIREKSNNGWMLKKFISYPSHQHCVGDMAIEANKESIERAALISKKILVHYKNNDPWQKVEGLIMHVYSLSDKNIADYKKKYINSRKELAKK